MNLDELMSLASSLRDSVSKKVDEVDIYFRYDSKLSIMAENQGISTEREGSELGFSIRVINKGREGFSYTNKIDIESLKKSAEEAIGISKIAPKKEDLKLPTKKEITAIPEIYSKSVSELEIGDIINDMKEILSVIRDSKIPVRVNLSSLSAEETWRGICNSNGIELYDKRNYYSSGMFAVARDGDKIGSFVVSDFFTRDPSSVDVHKFAENLVNKAVRNINPIKTEINSNTVIFQKEGTNPIFNVIGYAITADNVQQNRSMWKDKIGDQVAIDNLSVIDDSHNPLRGFGVKSFDDEGNPTKTTSIIKNGILENFLFDELHANRADTSSTGNSMRRGFTSPPNMIYPNAPFIVSGNMNRDTLIGEVDEGIIFDRFSGSVQAPNGIFSGVVKGAQLIKNGEITDTLSNVTIGGNIFDVLKNITGIGKEIDLINGYITSPMIRAENISIKIK